MKAFLILLNILLASGAAWSILSHTASPGADNEEYFIKRSPSAKKKTAAAAVPKKQPQQQTQADDADPAAVVIGQNIFDPARCPNARVPGRNRNNVRLNMTLVGTFEIGKVAGAIILQKQQRNQQTIFPFTPFGGGMMRPGMTFGSGMMNSNTATGGTQNANAGDLQQNRGSFRQRFGPGGFGGFGGFGGGMNNNANGQNNTENVVYKQYVRLGETMANGYTLTAVTRTGATLVKNSEKLELELVKASENTAAKTQNAGNAARGSMPMQPEQMRQWIEQMRAMRGGNFGGGNFGGGFMRNQPQNAGQNFNSGGTGGTRGNRRQGNR